MTNRDITGSEFTGFDMYDQPMKIGRRGPIHALARGYVDVSDRPRDIDPGMGVWPVTPGFNKERILPEWLKRESKILEEEENLAEGGIASLENRPGYAFAGVVDQNASPWITRKSDKDWITQSPDVNELLEDEENQWIQRRAEGGIASTRPGYVWGGLSALGKTRSQRAEDSINRLSDYLGPSRSDLTTGKFSGGVDRPSWGDYANTYSKYGDDRFTNVIKHNKLDTLRSLVNAGPLTNIIGRGVDLYKDWKGRDEDNPWGYQEGGAVGLEPGIASLMGYAKGGMVTKVKVPKGQSKWMKRFMNNMRDK